MGKSRRLFIIGVESIRCGRKSTDLTKCSGGCPSFFSPGLMASVFVDRETRPLVILLQTHPWLYECTSYRGGGGATVTGVHTLTLECLYPFCTAPRLGTHRQMIVLMGPPSGGNNIIRDRKSLRTQLSNCWRYISLVLQAYVFTYEYMYVCMRVCVYVSRPNLCVCMCI